MLIRNTAWTFGAQIVRLATALVLIAVLDPGARGLQSLLILLPTLVGSLASLGVGSATPVVLHRGVSESALLANLLGLAFCVLGIILLVLVPCLPLAARFLSDPSRYVVSEADVLLGFFFLPPTLIGDYLRSLLAARRDLRQVALTQSVQAVTQLLLALILVVGLRFGPLGAVWAAVLSAWVGFAWTIRAVWPLGKLCPRLDRDVLRQLLSLGLRGHVGNIVQTFNYRFDALFVQAYQGQAAVGLYQTSALLAEMLWYLPNAVSAALLPQVATTKDVEGTPRVARTTLLLTLLGAPVLFGGVALGVIFLRPAYRGAIAPLGILLVGVVALSVHKVLSGDFGGRGLPQYPTYTSSLALVVTLVGDLLLIPRLGIVGAAAISSAAYALQTVALTGFYLGLSTARWYDVWIPQREDIVVYHRFVVRVRNKLF